MIDSERIEKYLKMSELLKPYDIKTAEDVELLMSMDQISHIRTLNTIGKIVNALIVDAYLEFNEDEIIVVPAYGMDYTSQKTVLEAWNAEKDFQMVGIGQSGYINKRDAEKYGVPGNRIKIQYANKWQVVYIDVASS